MDGSPTRPNCPGVLWRSNEDRRGSRIGSATRHEAGGRNETTEGRVGWAPLRPSVFRALPAVSGRRNAEMSGIAPLAAARYFFTRLSTALVTLLPSFDSNL